MALFFGISGILQIICKCFSFNSYSVTTYDRSCQEGFSTEVQNSGCVLGNGPNILWMRIDSEGTRISVNTLKDMEL